jgi:fructuronate reductase
MADQLAPQDGLYTLITRGAPGDDFRLLDRSRGSIRVLIMRLISITCAAQRLLLSRSPSPRSDIWLARMAAGPQQRRRAGGYRGTSSRPGIGSDLIPGKLVAGLLARRSAGGGPITILPCDNLPESGLLTSVVRDFTGEISFWGARLPRRTHRR